MSNFHAKIAKKPRPPRTEYRLRCIFAFIVLLAISSLRCDAAEKPRLLVLTDIGGDPDDQQSLVRLLSYSNVFDIEGFVATSRMDHGKDVKPELIREQVQAYGKVRDNLLLHAPGFPTQEFLLERIKSGQPDADHVRATPVVMGEGKDTEGSEWIIAVADKADARPLWITIWGGSTDLAQALWKIQRTRTPEQSAAFVARLRVYAIADQDDACQWIRKNVPTLFLINPESVRGAPFSGTYRGMYQNESVANGVSTPLVEKNLYPLVSKEWLDENVRKNHGPLGALYPDNALQTPAKTLGLKEGDSPSWLYLIPNGLSSPDHPEWGGWGGRFSFGPQFVSGEDAHPSGSADKALRQKWTVARWREAIQNDFAARMDWHVKAFKDANHPPVAKVNGELARSVASGETVELDASASSDPDGNALTFRWENYREAGTFAGDVALEGADTAHARFTAPNVAEARTIHLVLSVRDNGVPALLRYQRVVISVTPAKK